MSAMDTNFPLPGFGRFSGSSVDYGTSNIRNSTANQQHQQDSFPQRLSSTQLPPLPGLGQPLQLPQLPQSHQEQQYQLHTPQSQPLPQSQPQASKLLKSLPRSDSRKSITTANNNMNSKVNKNLGRVPDNLGSNGTTPSGKPRLFSCAVCTRAFARHEHLKRHERSHTKEKPFGCGVCQRRFSRRDLLLRHATKLHEGCNDAIKRLRRRSSRAKNDTSSTLDTMSEELSDTEETSSAGGKRIKLGDSPLDNGLISQGGHFNYMFVNDNGSSSKDHQTGPDTNKRAPSSQQFANPNIGDFRGRRTSFSAVSGDNYASVPESQQNKPYAGSVGFASPQILPADLHVTSSTDDHNASTSMQNWISDINSLPGLNFLSSLQTNGVPATSQNEAHINHVLGIGPTESTPIHDDVSMRSDSMVSSLTRRSSKSNLGKGKKRSREKESSASDIYGYSFYDDNFMLGNENEALHDLKLSYPRLPSTYLNDTTSNSSPSGENSSVNPSNFNEYELLSELEVPNHEEQILSVGYSFYESNDFASSGISPTAARANLQKNLDDSTQGKGPLMEVEHPSDATLRASFHMSSSVLFTPALIDKIATVLARYPYNGLPPPDLPSLEYLNFFVENFKGGFLEHHPFIHKNYLNEKSMFEYTMNSDTPDDYAPAVCLPLLIATFGALYSQNKKQSADLYECSRRCIHVYLDSRKKTDESEKSTTHNSPLWLVQSLVLSVMYGLFAEYDDSDLSVILRQVNALCTLIKVSRFNLIRFSHENIEINDEYFRDYILYQSKVRTVFMIFNISSTLTCFYNLDPFLKYKEIKCDLPDLESYWECSSVSEFKQNCIKCTLNYNLTLEKILNDMLLNNQITYKISEFGSTVMMYTVLQYFFFNKKSALTNFSAGISPDHTNSSNLVKNYTWESMLTDVNKGINMESLILRNITVIRSLMIDLSNVKEAMWGRRWNDVCTEFIQVSSKNDDLIDACDYSLRTLSMMFVNDVDSSNFKRCQSLTCQALFFNFFYIAKFLYRFEKKVFKQIGAIPKKDNILSKNFGIYIKIAKFLADMEQLLTRNFGYHDQESKLAIVEFDASKITFGQSPTLLSNEPERDYGFESMCRIVRLCLSSNILKIGEFIFTYIYKEEMSFNIFKSLGEGVKELRLFLEADIRQEMVAAKKREDEKAQAQDLNPNQGQGQFQAQTQNQRHL